MNHTSLLSRPHPWGTRWSAMTPQARGWVWGALGVLMFALTLPMTRLAVGTVAEPQWSPLFVTAGRAAVAAVLSMAYLVGVRAPWPPRHLWWQLVGCGLGTVLGFPACLAIALRQVDASHAAVVTGLLPLATAVLAVRLSGRGAGWRFWACALTGAALVLGYALTRTQGGLGWADVWLLLAVLSAAGGYVAGARASQDLPAEQVTCWVLVGAQPLVWPMVWATWPGVEALSSIAPSAWWGLAYVSLFSMWLGFFAWYRGLALGGAVRVSQVQLLQPFLTLVFAVPLLGEPLDGAALSCALMVAAVVWVARRLPAPPAVAANTPAPPVA